MYRYYSTQRPVQIGGYPANEHVVKIYNFDNREYCEEIGRKAWGYIDYDKALGAEDVRNYELVLAGQKRKYSVIVKRYGYATVEAKSEDEAKRIAMKMSSEELNWDPVESMDVDVIPEEEV